MSATLACWLVGIVILRGAIVAGLQALSRGAFAQRHRVYDIPIRPAQRRRERYAPLAGATLDAAAIAALVHFQVLTLGAPSWREPLILLATHILVVEPLYYGYHRLLHTRFLYKHHHYLHHLSVVPEPNTSFTFTLAERASYTALFALPVLAASHLGALSVIGLTLYLVIFDIANAIGHLNFEFPGKTSGRSRWRLFFYTPSFHARHHSTFIHNFSLFMPVFDHLFKTADPEEDEVLERARSGRPFKRLGEKAKAVKA